MRGARVVLRTEGCPLAFRARLILNDNTPFAMVPKFQSCHSSDKFLPNTLQQSAKEITP